MSLREWDLIRGNSWLYTLSSIPLRYQQQQSLAQSVKTSRYYQSIPPVQVECPLLDGDNSSTPIIFEDKFSFLEPREPGICASLLM